VRDIVKARCALAGRGRGTAEYAAAGDDGDDGASEHGYGGGGYFRSGAAQVSAVARMMDSTKGKREDEAG